MEKYLQEESIKYSKIISYSSPTRLTVIIKDIPLTIKILAKEIKGPKVGVLENILDSFIRAQKVTKKDVFEKKSGFFCLKSSSHRN